MSLQLIHAKILHFPVATLQPALEYQYIEDGALIIQGERIEALGAYADIKAQYPLATYIDYQDKLLIPGLIDSHIHFPQTEMIASHGEQLLNWLENYTFPTEAKFAHPDYSKAMADVFIRQLLKNGTTTALCFSSVHESACDALFEAATQHDMAIIAGKVCMDRHCPEALQDTAQSAQRQSADLIKRWHNKGRNLYAITPRFAPTSSDRQLRLLGELAQDNKDVFIQTHLSENIEEIAWVNSLFPKHDGYLNVYDDYHLVRERSVFGHCVHLSDSEWQCLQARKASAAFCPSSNLFLGSGLFDLANAQQHEVPVVLATDVGAGSSFNMLRTYSDAYKISQLQHHVIHPLHGLYMMTQGPATAYRLADSIGNLNVGTHADFVVLDPAFNELSTLRNLSSKSAVDMLFALSMLGDERAVVATYVAGKNTHEKFQQESKHALA